jgi:hypothetical protein
LLKLYQIYDDHRNARLIFISFNPTPFWKKAKPIVEGMRSKRTHIYENFESLNRERLSWKEKRNTKRKMTPTGR